MQENFSPRKTFDTESFLAKSLDRYERVTLFFRFFFLNKVFCYISFINRCHSFLVIAVNCDIDFTNNFCCVNLYCCIVNLLITD